MHDSVPKLCGADVELGNFISGVAHEGGTGREASRRLLYEIDGLPVEDVPVAHSASPYADSRGSETGGWSSVGGGYAGVEFSPRQAAFDPQDWGRRFLPTNGGCAYIDMDHLEVCLPEVLSAYDHVACWHAMLRVARRAQTAANEKLPDDQRIEVLANNSDGLGNSYGSHLNFLIARRTWNNLFNWRIHQALYLAAYQASSIIFTGQGKVGSENNAPPADYQISQRADFFEVLCGLQTTYHRPILNTRDEPHCGKLAASGPGPRPYARLHVIFYDSSLAHVAALLKIGVMQIVLAMIEAGRVNNNLMLDDPVPAVQRWSHDPSLQLRLSTVDGTSNTAAELQLRFLDDASAFVAQGGCDGIVPDAGRILSLWADTVEKLHRRDFAALSSRLDWVLKRGILQRAMARQSTLTWHSPAIRMLDFLYSSLDPAKGLFWAYERAGSIERVVTEERVRHLEHEPPENTRAWTRAMVLRSAWPHHVRSVDWDSITVVDPRVERTYANTRTLTLPDPVRHTKAEMSELFADAPRFEDVLDAWDGPYPAANRSAASL